MEQFVLFLVCAIGLAVNGCGPKVELLRHDPGFDYESLSSGGISVCGVATTIGTRESQIQKRPRLTSVLEAVLRKERSDLSVFRTDSLRRVLGRQRYDTVLDDFEHTGEVSQATLAALDSLVGGQARYLIFARVENEAVLQDETATTNYDSNSETTTRTTTLEMRVAFHVYDIQLTRSVWSASLTGKKAEASSFTEDEPSGKFWEDLIASIFSPNDSEFPPAPEDVKVLKGIFSGFAKKLPLRSETSHPTGS